MNKLKIVLPLVAMLFACNKSNNNDWQVLFNGENLDGWVVKIYHHDFDDNYANTFRVVDGNIQVNYDDYDKFNERYGHLFYDKS